MILGYTSSIQKFVKNPISNIKKENLMEYNNCFDNNYPDKINLHGLGAISKRQIVVSHTFYSVSCRGGIVSEKNNFSIILFSSLLF